MKKIKFYIVGGYVRDKILGIDSRDCDYCVVGATPEDMFDKGFKQVGADFPVFLDENGEEYALARTERKNGKGYHGFDVDFGPEVTIKDDLYRRDLTINAIALGTDGEYIDPFNGIKDIEDKKLRHVSESFKEDPLRILRVARFSAKFPDFEVDESTMEMMKEMVKKGEVDALVSERVTKETIKALEEKQPSNYFKVLLETGALERIMPELSSLHGVPQPEEHHPEIDSFVHTMLTLDQATKMSNDPIVRFSALVHDLGKGITPKEEWPQHLKHEINGVPIVEKMCDRLKFPNDYKKSGMIASRYHLNIHRAFELSDKKINKLFKELSVDRNKNNQFFENLLTVSEADAKGRKGFENRLYPQANFIKELAEDWSKVKMRDIMEEKGVDKILPEKLNSFQMALQHKRVKSIKKNKTRNLEI